MSARHERNKVHNLLEKINEEEDEEEDLIEIQLQSSIIKVNFVNLFTYSKFVRDEYQTLKETRLRLSNDFQNFQKDYDISDENCISFFKIFKNENFLINNQNYDDLFRLSHYFQVKKLNVILKQYKENHAVDIDFVINQIIKQNSVEISNSTSNDQFNTQMEAILSKKVNECLQNKLFSLLHISIIYRILSKSEEQISSDLLFDFISKSIENRYQLLTFLDIQNLSESKLGELFDLYDQYKNHKPIDYFQYLPTNLTLLKSAKDENKQIQSQFDDLKDKYDILQKKLNCYEDVFKALKYMSFIGSDEFREPFTQLTQLSQKGNAQSSYLLGVMHEIKENGDLSLQFYQKAVEQGNLDAICNIGSLYAKGKGVERDDSKALEYFQRSAENGNEFALLNIGELYYRGGGVERDYSKALEYLQRSADLGCPPALFYIGALYREGQGVEQDYSKALEYFQRSADLGCPLALFGIGALYLGGQGVEQDYSKALEYFQRSANQGLSSALFIIGEMYENGKGVEKDLSKALAYYEKSDKLGFHEAHDKIDSIKKQLSK